MPISLSAIISGTGTHIIHELPLDLHSLPSDSWYPFYEFPPLFSCSPAKVRQYSYYFSSGCILMRPSAFLVLCNGIRLCLDGCTSLSAYVLLLNVCVCHVSKATRLQLSRVVCNFLYTLFVLSTISIPSYNPTILILRKGNYQKSGIWMELASWFTSSNEVYCSQHCLENFEFCGIRQPSLVSETRGASCSQ